MADRMTVRRILATSGGFVSTGLWGVSRPGNIFLEALRLSGADRPRVCLVMTASGDNDQYLTSMYSALSNVGCDVDHLALFSQPNRRPEDALGAADVIWVGGGSVANLLALWRLHGVDTAMAEAWERGAILGGVSAGSICWHVGGPTDSFGVELQPVTNGLGLLPYGNGVHYDSELQRRPLMHQLVGDGTLPTSYATDDGIGILYEGIEPVAVVADLLDSHLLDAHIAGADDRTETSAYRIEVTGGDVTETRLPVGRITA
jgi:peptidase E